MYQRSPVSWVPRYPQSKIEKCADLAAPLFFVSGHILCFFVNIKLERVNNGPGLAFFLAKFTSKFQRSKSW